MAPHPHLSAYIGHGTVREERAGDEPSRTCRDREHKRRPKHVQTLQEGVGS